MPIKIRLRRMGRKKQPHYRIVIADSDSPRDGRFVESIGFYKPLSHPARIVLDLERVEYWEGKGALPTPTVANLIKKARKGGDESVAVGEVDKEAEKLAYLEALAARRRVEAEVEAKADAEAAAEAKAKEAKAAKAKKKDKAEEIAPEPEAAEAVVEEAAPEPEAAEEVVEESAPGAKAEEVPEEAAAEVAEEPTAEEKSE